MTIEEKIKKIIIRNTCSKSMNNDINNLTTACETCNVKKRARKYNFMPRYLITYKPNLEYYKKFKKVN